MDPSAASSLNLMNMSAPPPPLPPSNTTHSIPYETSISISFYKVSLVQVVECPTNLPSIDSNKNSGYIPSVLLNTSPPPPNVSPHPQPPPPSSRWKWTTQVIEEGEEEEEEDKAHMASMKTIRIVWEGNKYKAALVQVVE